jgi:UDP-N-acetylglucosamine--dolichyl-phosphate N-acetylglucosaminephosphotransferase
MPPPRPLSALLLASLFPVSAWLIVWPLTTHLPLPALSASLGFSILAFLSTLFLVPALGPAFVKVGLKGRDMLKQSREEM